MMSTKLNVETFIAVLRKSGLVDRDRLDDALNDFPMPAGSDDPLPLVDRLLSIGLLTKWQAEKLLQGKHRGYFLGKYKLLSLLGKGGMSSVYLAEHLLMRRRCALKVLPAKRVDDSSYLERFHREAQAVALLDHPNIVRAYDVDHQSDGDRKIHFLVMEHVDGLSLQEMVTAKGGLPFLDAAEYTRQAAAGLQDAHEHGMVHRDIKPGNLLVDQNGIVKILDLGLAKFFTSEEGEEALTIRHDEKVLGTADYLAPEQALDSHTVDARADLYSLGCTLYFMLSGQPPFTEGTLAQRLMAHQVKTPPPVESIRTDAPPSLVAILRKMMEKQADDRYATAGELETALFRWIDQNADLPWRNAHSGVYGSRVTQSEAVRKAIPIAQPVVAKITSPAAPEFPRSQTPSSNQSKSDSQPVVSQSAIDTQDTAMDQFLSTLAQSNTDLKTPNTASNPSIKSPLRSSGEHVIPELPSLALPPAPPSQGTSAFPVFEPYEHHKSPATRSSVTLKAITDSRALVRPKGVESFKALIAAWGKLPAAARKTILILTGFVLIFTLYSFSAPDSDGPLPGGKQPPMKVFPRDKREITVGGPNAEYKTIKDALIAIRNRYRPPIANTDKFVMRISAGTYNEKIRIDGRSTLWPEGVVLQGEGQVILEASGDDPIIRLSNVSRLTIDNIQINAKDKLVAIEVIDDVHESRLSHLIVRGFSSAGVKCKGAQGLSFGNNQFVLEQLTFESAASQAIGIRLEEGTENDVNSIIMKGCRFLGPMAAGIVIQGHAPFGLEIRESIFNKTADGIRIDGSPVLKSLVITNNTFQNSRYGVRFSSLPSDQSSGLMLRRNLFTNTERTDVAVSDDYDENRFRSMLSNNPPGIENNWSDRAKPATPIKGEVGLIFENNGRPGVQDFAFGSTDPKNPRFLMPTEKSPQRSVGGAQPTEKNWVGAFGP